MSMILTELVSATMVCKDVTLPGTNVTVRIRRLSGEGRAAMMETVRRWKNDQEAPAASKEIQSVVLRHGLIDSAGQPLVVGDEEMKLLAHLDGSASDLLVKEILDLSNLGQNASQEAEKNSASSQSDDSGSASPATSAAA